MTYLPSVSDLAQLLMGPNIQTLEKKIIINHNKVKNPSWEEASQSAINMRGPSSSPEAHSVEGGKAKTQLKTGSPQAFYSLNPIS